MRYDSTFYPHGSTQVHYTRNITFKLGEDTVATAMCGKTFTRWIYGENVDKPVCKACQHQADALTQDQINAVVYALDGQNKSIAEDALTRLSAAFNFQRDRFVWCDLCSGFRPEPHNHT